MLQGTLLQSHTINQAATNTHIPGSVSCCLGWETLSTTGSATGMNLDTIRLSSDPIAQGPAQSASTCLSHPGSCTWCKLLDRITLSFGFELALAFDRYLRQSSPPARHINCWWNPIPQLNRFCNSMTLFGTCLPPKSI